MARLAECLSWRAALLDLLDRIREERAFYRTVLEQGGQEGMGEMIPLEEVLETVQIYYRDRCGRPPDRAAEEQERRWGRTILPPEELADALERAVERGTEGVVWQSLRERGEWNEMT